MKKFYYWIRGFFFPEPGTPWWLIALPFAVIIVISASVLVGGSYVWEYTNSPEFCGTACHTMPPQFSAYQISPHARVKCVECHIGRDAFATQITRKAGDVRHIILNITKAFEYPIRTNQMRPARESCETCHYPEKFSDDSLRNIQTFNLDEENSVSSLFLLMRTGGGTAREGLGFGIHWHVENQVLFMAEDDLEQKIPYVKVVDLNGGETEYFDINSEISASDIDEAELIEMDCITCHNRITHSLPSPAEAVGQAVNKGFISSGLPYIIREGEQLLRGNYADKDTGIEAMQALGDFYAESYPDLYKTMTEEIDQAVLVLQDIYTQSVFPDQKFDWDTHPDNIGHKDDPGCFRCHDGGHISTEGELIRLECNICHSIPTEADPDSLVIDIQLVSGPEPQSHTASSWIPLHGSLYNETCLACHPTASGEFNISESTGKPEIDGTFCGNSACHANNWEFTGFKTENMQTFLNTQLLEMLPSPTPIPTPTMQPTAQPEPEPTKEPEQTSAPLESEEAADLTFDLNIGPLFQSSCVKCHNPDLASSALDLSTYENVLAGGANGAGIIPGDPDSSMIVAVQTAEYEHFGAFSPAEVEKIIQWIVEGAVE